MAKEIIIDGVDVSGCGKKYPDSGDDVYCDETNCALLCKEYPDCYYKQLKRKEQELQELTERLERTEEDLEEECTRCAATNRLEEQIETLQAENEKLKQELEEAKYEANMWQEQANIRKEIGYSWQQQHDKLQAENEKLKEKFEQTDEAAHELLQDNADYAWDNECYKQALDSISDIIHKTTDIGGVPLSEDDCIKILSIIKQADLRRVEPTEGSEPDNVRAIVDGNDVKSTACPRESKSKTAKGEE